MAKVVRWIFVGSLMFLALPIIQEFVIELARENGFYENPTQRVGGALSYVEKIADIPGFYYLLALAAGGTLGAWLDTLLRRLDAKRPTKAMKASELRYKIRPIIDEIEWQKDAGVGGVSVELRSKIKSLYIAMQKLGFTVPTALNPSDRDAFLAIHGGFLSYVLPLISDGHVAEAQKAAKEAVAALGKVVEERGGANCRDLR